MTMEQAYFNGWLRPHPRRLFGLALAFFALAGSGWAAGAEPVVLRPDFSKPLSQRYPLIVGATSDSYPYGFVNGQGEWAGYASDLFDAVARVMGLKFRRTSARGNELARRFKEGEFDMLQAFSQTQSREEFAEYSVPYLTLQGALFVQRKNSPIRKLEDLNGVKFAVIGNGSVVERFLRDHGLHVEVLLVSSSEEALSLLENGECTATFVSQLTALSVVERMHLKNVAMFGQPFPDYDIRHCFAVHRGDAQLLARINEGLAILERSGELQKIHERWFGRFTPRIVTYTQVVTWGAVVFALAFTLAFVGFLRQRMLRRRIARQAEALADQEALLRALYDNLPFVVCVLEGEPDNPRVLSLNREGEQYLGRTAREAEGQLLRDLPVELEWSRHLKALMHQKPGASGFVREERSLSSAKKRLMFMLLPLPAGRSGSPRTCLLVEDVTERRSLDDEIAQSRKLRAVGELVGGIAHEFNNLLTPIMLNTNLIKQDWPNDPRLHQELDLIARAGQRGAELTRRLLAFGRKSEIRIETVRLAAVVENCFALMRLTLDRRIQWENLVPADLPPIHVNVTDLNQVIANLILNARDTLLDKLGHQREGWTPRITIRASVEPLPKIPAVMNTPKGNPALGWQRLTVSDNGMGMTSEVRERIFEPFYTTKEVGKGTGLGLATVWHLLQEAGGHIDVESRPGLGSTFHVWLPVMQMPETGESPAPAAEGKPAPVRARIFLADDDDLVARTIVASLQRAGHAVHREADGSAALEFLQATHRDFEMIILDVNMPGLDGIEVAQRVRDVLKYEGKIMIISGRLGSNDLSQITQARVDAVLTKPFGVKEFLDAVNACLVAKPPA